MSQGMEKNTLKDVRVWGIVHLQIWKFVDYDSSLQVDSNQWCILYLLCAAVHNGAAFDKSLLLRVMNHQPSSFSSSASETQETSEEAPNTSTNPPPQNEMDSFLQFSPMESSPSQDAPSVQPQPQPSFLMEPSAPSQAPVLSSPQMGVASPQQPQSPFLQPQSIVQPQPLLQPQPQPLVQPAPIQTQPQPVIPQPLLQPQSPLIQPQPQSLLQPQSPILQPAPVQPQQPQPQPLVQPQPQPQQPQQPQQPHPQQPQQPHPQQPQQPQPQQPQQPQPPTPTIQDCTPSPSLSPPGMMKITVLWTRVAQHTLAFVTEGADAVPLKLLIAELRKRDVDLPSLKTAVSVFLNETAQVETITMPQVIRLLVLLDNPNTPLQAPRCSLRCWLNRSVCQQHPRHSRRRRVLQAGAAGADEDPTGDRPTARRARSAPLQCTHCTH